MNLDRILKSMHRIKNDKDVSTKYGFTNFITYLNSLIKKAKAGNKQAEDKLVDYWGLIYYDGSYYLPNGITFKDIWVLKILNEFEIINAYGSEAQIVKNTALVRFNLWETKAKEKSNLQETN